MEDALPSPESYSGEHLGRSDCLGGLSFDRESDIPRDEVVQDAGVKMKLEHLAVLFKSEKNIPCRAALKAKSLTIEVEKGQNEGDQVFQCFDLSDIAATAVVNCEKCDCCCMSLHNVTRLVDRNSGPRLDSLKVALGTIQATIHQALLEDGIRCLQSLPQNIASPKVSSPKRPNKRATASFLPRKVIGLMLFGACGIWCCEDWMWDP